MIYNNTLKVFDAVQVIKNRDGLKDVDAEMIGKLDELLTTYGVAHAFTEAWPGAEGCIDEDEVCRVLYMDDEYMTFGLVYMLWSKTVREVPDDRILKAFRKVSDRILGKDE